MGAANGSPFVLDGLPSHCLEFTPASSACHPNQVWDALVGDMVGGRGYDVRLQLWIVETGDRDLVLGNYSSMDTDAMALEGTRNIVASLRIAGGGSTYVGELPADAFGPGW